MCIIFTLNNHAIDLIENLRTSVYEFIEEMLKGIKPQVFFKNIIKPNLFCVHSVPS